MADLIDRLSGKDPLRPQIPIHQFVARLGLVLAGVISEAEAGMDFDLQGDEMTQATALLAQYASIPDTLDKLVYHQRVKDVIYMVEHDGDTVYHDDEGGVDKARVVADLGI